jgi:hypothetical protein
VARDMLIGKGGDSVRGEILNDSFTIAGPLGTVTLPLKRIRKITFYYKPQQILLFSGDVVNGVIKEKSIRFKRDGGPTGDVPTSALLFALVGTLISKDSAALDKHFK